jgi:signal transduction histidine kinase
VRGEKVAAFLEKTLPSGDKVEGWDFDEEIGGVQRRFSLSVWPLVHEHQVSGSLIHVEEITEKVKREALMRRMESLASLTTLAAGVAHEIKNPLGSLSIHIQLIQKTLVSGGSAYNKAIDKYLSVVNEEIARLNQIVVDFLFAVRPMNMELRYGDINALISEVAEFVSYELKAAGIDCVLDLREDLPCVNFDERFMKQALLNLIKNAIAAMDGGGRFSIKTAVLDETVLITVSDNGAGISEENLPKIFEPYFTTRETGSGLGLTLVFKIIREHQGEITVKSRQGEGTAFTITLPVPQKERRLIGGPS